MSDNTRLTVKSGCVHLSEVEDKHKNRLRVYWGSIRFPKPKDDGGAWLNTGWDSPTIVVEKDELTTLLERAGLAELDDLSGAFFAFMGKLRVGVNGKPYFFVNKAIDWVAVRPFSSDDALN